MGNDKLPSSRRNVIKSIVGSATLLGVAGSAQAAQSDTKSETKAGAASKTTRLTDENALSRSQVEKEVQRLSEKYGDEAAQNVLAGPVDTETGKFGEDVVSVSGSGPDNTTNLNYLKSWNQEYKVQGGTPERLLLTTDHFLSVYKSNDTDDQGRYRYFYWHWSQTETNSDYWHDETHLQFIRNRLNIRSNDEEVTKISPSSTSDLNGRQKSVGVTVGYGGAEFGISGEVYVKDATFGPETGGVEKGPAGEFSAYLDANNTQGRQSLNATTVTRHEADRSGFYDCKWTTECGGRQ
ncbi:hypothetical protein NGM10_03575 [Halorussus salilacus]|uniref:hypothetical protein n=1 Tax=Halorussus salilacus TaxID=2953750 RepID=UPI00209D5887|nr:hypothetical protein [Halorussus salilacus]USZ68821.1 hypothetical protein NGM10_03575 [Halorussus salilacus]